MERKNLIREIGHIIACILAVIGPVLLLPIPDILYEKYPHITASILVSLMLALYMLTSKNKQGESKHED